MRKGKLDLDCLNRIVKSYTGVIHKETLLGSNIGEDSCIVDLKSLDQDVIFISSDPITITSNNIGKLSIIINSNDIYASGGKCYGVILNVLLPQKSTIDDFEDIMRDIHYECLNHDLEILGGHTEVTDVVTDILVSVTIIGFGRKHEIVKTCSSKVGDLIFLTKPLAMEGTVILFDKFVNILSDVLSQEEIDEVNKFRDKMSIKDESMLLRNFEISSMHDITEGGLIGALLEMSLSSGNGFKVFEDRINVHSSTRKICNHLNKDIYRMISSGNLLFTVGRKYKTEIENIFLSADIQLSEIGEVVREGVYIFSKHDDEDVPVDIKDSIFD